MRKYSMQQNSEVSALKIEEKYIGTVYKGAMA